MTCIHKGLRFLLAALFTAGIAANVAAVQMEFYNTHPLIDENGTPLQGAESSGDLVQLILVGNDNLINAPNPNGDASGDDTVLLTTHVGAGLPGSSNQGLLDVYPVDYSDSLIASNAYVRFWNAGTAMAATAYGETAIFALPAGDIFNQAFFDFVPVISDARTTDIPLPSPVGSYSGLLMETNDPSSVASGAIALKVSATGAFAAKLSVGGVRVSIKGQFDDSGTSTNMVVTSGLGALTVILQLELADGVYQVVGSVSSANFSSAVLAELAAYGKTNPCPWAGVYPFLLDPASFNDPAIPPGYGYGTLTVDTSGKARVKGVLGDGAKLKGLGTVSKFGTIPLYSILYKKLGSCIAWVTLETNDTLTATMDWFKPALPTEQRYPAGFTTVVDLAGAKSVSPGDIAGTWDVTLGGGNLVSNLTQTVNVDALGNVTVPMPNTESLTMKVAPATGVLSGSFVHPVTLRKVKFGGQLLPSEMIGAGFFLGTDQAGFVTVEPSP